MEKKSSSNTLVGVLLLVVVLIAIGVAGYFLFLKEDKDSEDESQEETMVEDTRTVELKSKSSINQYGTAVLKEEDGQVSVELSLINNPNTSQPVHIHRGNCDAPGEIIVNLTNVVDGQSSTIIDLTFEDIDGEAHVITGHRAADDLGTYDFCGTLSD